jgi:hypothetical protein
MATEHSEPITLPSGVVSAIRRPKGRDFRMSRRQAEKDDGGTAAMFAPVARVTTIGGRTLTLEDIDEMDLADINALSEALGTDFLSSRGASSPSSSSADSE